MKRNFMVLACVAVIFAGTEVFAQEYPTLSIVPGNNWKSIMWIGFIPIKHSPQIAAWVENSEGAYVATLLVSERAGKKNWYGAPDDGRPESLPVWLHAAQASAGRTSAIDAATSATPSGAEAFHTRIVGLTAGKPYRVRLEINHSFDFNETWTKKAKKGNAFYCGVNGQPSLVYEACFVAGTPGNFVLNFIGQGSIDGFSGAVTEGQEGLSSALIIIESATLSLK